MGMPHRSRHRARSAPEATSGRVLGDVAIVLVVTALALLIRGLFFRMPVQCDEAAVYLEYCRDVDRPLYGILTHPPRIHNHVLFMLITGATWMATGWWFPLFRLPALVIGVAAVPATYGLARTLTDRRTAAVAAVLTACSSIAIRYSIEARGYGLAMVLSAGSTWAVIRALRSGRRGWWMFATALVVAATYTILSGAYLAMGLAIGTVVAARIREVPWRAALRAAMSVGPVAISIAGVLYLPMVLRWGWERAVDPQMRAYSAPDSAAAFAEWLTGYIEMLGDGVLPTLPYAGLLCLGSIVLARRVAFETIVPAAVILAPVPICFVTGAHPPARALSYVLPAASVFAAAGLMQLIGPVAQWLSRASGAMVQRRACGAAIVGVLVCSATVLTARWPYPSSRSTVLEDYGPVAERILGLEPPADYVFAQSALVACLRYHFAERGADPARVRLPDVVGRRSVLVYRPEQGINDSIRAALKSYRAGSVVYRTPDGVAVLRLQPRPAALVQGSRRGVDWRVGSLDNSLKQKGLEIGTDDGRGP